MLMKNFDKIKVLATAKKIKLSDVATAAGISYQQLNRIIRTQSTTIETMGRIADALGVPGVSNSTARRLPGSIR